MIVIDYHGYSIQEAYDDIIATIKECHEERIKKIKIITGKGSICQEFPLWIECSPLVRKIEQSDDGGCFYLWILVKKK